MSTPPTPSTVASTPAPKPAAPIGPHRIPPTPILPSAKPIRLEKRGSLFNPYVIASIAIILIGALLAGDGNLLSGGILLAIGLPSLLIFTVRSLTR